MPRGRILFIDAYDSFSNNITALLKAHLPVTVQVIRIDDPAFVFNDDAFRDFLTGFDAVVAGPGPGHPANADDVGLIGKLWHLPEARVLPVLGICLGFQSLGLAFGASVERLSEPRHGLVTPITHCDGDVFAGTNGITATQYHSLRVVLHDGNEKLGARYDMWMSSPGCKEIQPLAWDVSDHRNGPILMGLRHRAKPFWGVQYHPESICSSGGEGLLRNWWREVCVWNAAHSRKAIESPKDSGRASPSILDLSNDGRPPRGVQWQTVKLASLADTACIVESLRSSHDHEPILLESGVRNGDPVNPETGRFSIIGIHDKTSLQLRWSTGERTLTVTQGGKVIESRWTSISEVFDTLESTVDAHRAVDGPSHVPFWGGLVGFISYEAGLETIAVSPTNVQHSHPDVWFVLVQRSVVVDHIDKQIFIQSVAEDDTAWLNETTDKLRRLATEPYIPPTSPTTSPVTPPARIQCEPQNSIYCHQVAACQSYLRAGSSYELCLTDQTLIHTPTGPWALYRRLRATNPAPFGAYLHFTTAETSVRLLSSSPERFLSWSREGVCQFRPIKGTVKKTEGMTRARAEAILGSEKERAENLMIVDLIRHDLGGVAGVHNLHVPHLMAVEEYTTVYQLVSVISGQLPTHPSTTLPRGIPALASSLPPGSMTGAPKKRSCELLQSLENGRRRGLYSGVLGYLDVGGGGDFAVVIRSAFRWEGLGEEEEAWRVGAGGAVTVLSEPQAEWEEMMGKRERVVEVVMGG